MHLPWSVAAYSIIDSASSVIQNGSSSAATLSYGSFQGLNSGNVTSFLGMPFAEPPLGNLRFAPPQPPTPFEGVRDAVTYGAACPQQRTTADTAALPFKFPSIIDPISGAPNITNTSEDCLFINVMKPTTVNSTDGLPVLLWFFGGAFETGDASSYPGAPIVERSLVLGEPVIFVSANYRLNAFGFLASQEVQDVGATNIGLRDQRFAMQWVHDHIAAFGGDPSKVILWGESAGSQSVGLHFLIDNGTTGLFRGAFMESGSPYTLPSMADGQPYYDHLVEYTNCSGQADSLQCLRETPFDLLMGAVNSTPSYINYTSLNLAWRPRIDGDLLTQNPQRAIQQGLYAKVPFVTGDCDDEGTIFSLANLNITTDEEFLDYIHYNYLPNATQAQITALGEAYPEDPADGSPFGTGDEWNITSQYKRLAAFQGDFAFQAGRRFFLEVASATQDTWAFLYKRDKSEPVLGSYHSSDIVEFFTDVDYIGMDALINFATNLDPNAPGGLPSSLTYLSDIDWEQWDSSPSAPPLLTFWDPAPTVNITSDTYRLDAMKLITNITLQVSGN